MKTKIVSRRDVIRLGGSVFAGALAAQLFGACAGNGEVAQDVIGATTTGAGVTGSTACGVIPSETAGPYPAHDDSAINVLRLSGIERSDIRSSLNAGSYSGTAIATGVPLTLTLNLVSASSNCATALKGYAIYLWHCDSNGKYSMYSSGVTNQTYLRGVQETDANGSVTFQTIFPGCYDGRLTHIHFEIYPTISQAVDDNYVVKTSQLAFPTSVCNEVYVLPSYSTSKANFAKISASTDNVFSDGTTYQIATVKSGNTTSGYVANLRIAI